MAVVGLIGVVLGSPHLVLAHVAHDDRLALGDFRELVDHELRQQLLAVADLDAGPLLAPLPDGVHPLAVVGAALSLQFLVQDHEHVLDVTHNGDVAAHVLADLGRVDVDVDHLGPRSES